MAVINFELAQKPYEQRVIDAACIYWNVSPAYFKQKLDDSAVVYRKAILYYLMRKHTDLSFQAMAKIFGFTSHQPVQRSVKQVEIYLKSKKYAIEDVGTVERIAEGLNVNLVTANIKFSSTNKKK